MSGDALPISEVDVAVVGSGAAGLHAAIRAAELGARTALIARKPLQESSSYWAQGGLAAALAPDDSISRHAEDTFSAGRGLCRAAAVRTLVAEAPAAVEWLIERGVEFDREPSGELALGLEGGHSARRIVHAGGSETGRAITRRLFEIVAETKGLTVIEETSALSLWSDGERCGGLITNRGPLAASATILATGGGAALWRRTTNPWGAIGAGPVIAHAAGAELGDLEFCQFHPTALALPGSEHDGKLITEAVRGEGATLLGADGRRFTDELAPRDQVTAAVSDRIRADMSNHVLLDLRQIDPAGFPNVFAMLAEAGFDPATEPIPVAPASHYLMGGIVTDTEGRSSLPGLFAVGECACSGLHGANRLASNSLSECFVFGGRAAQAAAGDAPQAPPPLEPEPEPSPKAAPTSEPEPGQAGWRFSPPTIATRDAMWRYAGPSRDNTSLSALEDDPYPLARLISAAALERCESRGAHRRADFPMPDHELDGVHLVLGADGVPRRERWT